MYVVTRTFRDANGVFEVGSIVDPTSVRTFKSRLQQRHITNVDEENVKEWAEYFKNRHGIDLSEKLAEYLNARPEEESVVVPMEGSSARIEPEQISSEEDESW
ncbi:MAG: hypothetical protein IKS09_05145 [Lachnospiraceae bacterium]|nr:hypothetical protein [Lachnospiraceae bacterium]